MTLKKAMQQIRPVSSEAKKAARLRWDQVAKPLNSLGIWYALPGLKTARRSVWIRSGLPSCAQTMALWKRALPRPDRK
mgnify:CR=1 FL=1